MGNEFDPYKELGVSVTAATADIKRAYKKRSKEAHPDAGGSNEEFDRVSKAYRLLTDQRMRDRFDKTGSTEDTVDNTLANAINELGTTFIKVLMHPDIERIDIVREVRNDLVKRMRAEIKNVQEHKNNIATVDRVRKRIRKKGGELHDIVEATYENVKQDARQRVMHAEDQVKTLERAIEILKDYECEAPKNDMDVARLALGRYRSSTARSQYEF